jgi:hypothetical protein
MTEIELESIYEKTECPACGKNEFMLGPRGGIMQNIKCTCGMAFNVIDPECWDSRFPQIGQVLDEPVGYIPKLPKPKSKYNWFLIIHLLIITLSIIIGVSIAKNYPEIREFIDLQFYEKLPK